MQALTELPPVGEVGRQDVVDAEICTMLVSLALGLPAT
jgi:hypothetical protein